MTVAKVVLQTRYAVDVRQRIVRSVEDATKGRRSGSRNAAFNEGPDVFTKYRFRWCTETYSE